MTAIEDGRYQSVMKARMGELAQQKAEIEARLAPAPADVPDVHPNIAELYRVKITRLAETLANADSNGEEIRSLVGEVVLTPGEKRGEINAILRGELMAILDLAEGRRRSPRPEVITTALACPRNQATQSRPAPCTASGAPMREAWAHASSARSSAVPPAAPHFPAVGLSAPKIEWGVTAARSWLECSASRPCTRSCLWPCAFGAAIGR
jgi:hypothetical protein